jgi:hypothetical protein
MAPCLKHAGIRVSADTKTWATCPIRAVLALNPLPAGGLRLPAGKHGSMLIYYQTFVKEKIKKSVF